MRLTAKLIFIVVCVFIVWLGFTKAFGSLKERYLYKFIGNRFRVFVDKKWDADLYVGSVKGDILRNISLKNIVVNDIKILPEGFQIKADSLDLTYPPFGLLFGKADGKFENLRLVRNGAEIPLDAYQRKDTAIIVIQRSVLKLDDLFNGAFAGISVYGTIESEGEIILKKLEPHLVRISFNSKDFELDYKKTRMVKGAFKLEAVGKPKNADISGNIEIKRAEFSDGLSFLSLFKDLNFGNEFLDSSIMDISIKGENIIASNQYLRAKLKIEGELKKEKDAGPRLLGGAVITGGIFRVYANQFRIADGGISFVPYEEEPVLNITEEGSVGSYRITAKISGGKDRGFTLSSQPALSREDILSLLRFGKYSADLKGPEKEGLTRVDFNVILINNLFAY